MKKALLFCLVGILGLSINLYAADGDLIVDGDLGVGTVTPADKVHIAGAGQLAIDVNGSNAYFGNFANQNDAMYGFSKSGEVHLAINSTSGNVGVGTIAPVDKMHVAGAGQFAIDVGGTNAYFGSFLNPAGPMYGFSKPGAVQFAINVSSGNVGVGTAAPSCKFYVSGQAGGTTTWWHNSDRKLKKNIRGFDNALDKVMQLSGVSFEWDKEALEQFLFKDSLPGEKALENSDKYKDIEGRKIGFIAQDVENIVPEVVDQKDGVYMMSYSAMVPLLLEAIKEQQQIIDNLNDRVTLLEQQSR